MEKLYAAKSALRTSIKAALKGLSPVDRNLQSAEVTKKVINHPKYKSSQGVSVFLSLKDEVDTADIVRHIFASGKRCYIPRYSEGGDHMTMVRINSLDELGSLPKTKWNIPQPLEGDGREDCLESGGLDLILAPGLGFTRDGWRLGRGKGYYDNFLRTYNASFQPPYIIGLALKPCVMDNIPCTPNDFKLDEVVYPAD